MWYMTENGLIDMGKVELSRHPIAHVVSNPDTNGHVWVRIAPSPNMVPQVVRDNPDTFNQPLPE